MCLDEETSRERSHGSKCVLNGGGVLLLVEDDDLAVRAYRSWLRGRPLVVAGSATEARALFLSRSDWVGVIVDAGLPEGSDSGVDLVRWLRARAPGLPLALTSGQDSLEVRVAAPILDVPFFLKVDVTEQFKPFLRRCERYSLTRPERIAEDARERYALTKGEADVLEWVLTHGRTTRYATTRGVSRTTSDKRKAGVLRKTGSSDLLRLALALWKESRDGE